MEELIWKYIDGECTREEVLKVKQLLKTDETFKNEYDHCYHLHHQLKAKSKTEIPKDFYKTMTLQVSSFVKSQQSKPKAKPLSITQILPLPVIASIILGTITSIIILSKNQIVESNYIKYVPEIDATYMSYAIWSMAGFLLLYFADLILLQLRSNKATKKMMMV